MNTTVHRALRATLGAHHTSSKRQKLRNSLVVRVKILFTAPRWAVTIVEVYAFDIWIAAVRNLRSQLRSQTLNCVNNRVVHPIWTRPTAFQASKWVYDRAQSRYRCCLPVYVRSRASKLSMIPYMFMLITPRKNRISCRNIVLFFVCSIAEWITSRPLLTRRSPGINRNFIAPLKRALFRYRHAFRAERFRPSILR